MIETVGLRRIGDLTARALGWISGAALMGMMLLTFADVTGRKFFVAIPGAFELSEMLMVVLLFSALPLVAWHAEHVCFELVDSMYKGRWALWSRRFMDACCALAFGALGIAVWGLAGRTIAEREVSSRLHIPIGLFVYLMAVLLAAAALMHLLRAFGAEPPPDLAHPGGRMTACLLGFAAIFALMALRIPIAVSMALVGYFGLGLLKNFNMSLASLLDVVRSTGFSYTLSVVPLFILMGNFTARAGMARELFDLARAFLGHFRGGLAISTIGACAGFGAVCGSSVATAATMAKVAYPSMKELGYSDELSAGAISAGGTLGILIPPSTIMVIYGLMTETSIGKLFAAGIIPGILMTVLMCLAVAWVVRRHPDAGAASRRFNWTERFKALRSVWAVVVLFGVVMGGIYGGLFTATEGAGFGAFGAFLFALTRGNLSGKELGGILVESARTTAMLFAILIGALIFGNFVNFTGMPDQLRAFVSQFGVHPILVIVAICTIYVVLGTAMEELSMILLTVPVFFPLVVQLGFDPHWFGVLIVCVVMVGLISPPVGMNLFVLTTLLPQVRLASVFRGVWPFIAAQIVGLVLLIAFPGISLWILQFLD